MRLHEVTRGYKRLLVGAVCLVSIIGCTSGRTEPGEKVIVQINKYRMTEGDLRYELKNMPFDDMVLLSSEEGKRGFLDRIIEKELLLQEAQRQGIDREKDFMKSIENYWEQALLKVLLERKSKEISGLTYVYDNEIEEYYRDSGETLPISKVRNDIREVIKQKRQTEAMETWINELKQNSYIKINGDALKDVFSNNQ
jgi:hypothetical protein